MIRTPYLLGAALASLLVSTGFAIGFVHVHGQATATMVIDTFPEGPAAELPMANRTPVVLADFFAPVEVKGNVSFTAPPGRYVLTCYRAEDLPNWTPMDSYSLWSGSEQRFLFNSSACQGGSRAVNLPGGLLTLHSAYAALLQLCPFVETGFSLESMHLQLTVEGPRCAVVLWGGDFGSYLDLAVAVTGPVSFFLLGDLMWPLVGLHLPAGFYIRTYHDGQFPATLYVLPDGEEAVGVDLFSASSLRERESQFQFERRASGLLVLATGWIAGLLASAALLAWIVVRKYRDGSRRKPSQSSSGRLR